MSRINEIILDKFQSYAIIDIKWSAQMNQYQKTTEKRSKLLYRPQKVRPKNLTFWRSVFLCQNIHLN